MDSGNTHSESAMMTSSIFISTGGRYESEQYPVLMEHPGPESPPFPAPPGPLELPMDMDHAELSRSRSPKRPLFDDDDHLRNHKHPMHASYRDDLNDGMSEWEEISPSEVVDLPGFKARDEGVEADLPAPEGSSLNYRRILSNKGLFDNPHSRLFIILSGSDPQEHRLHFLCEGVEGSDGSHEHDLRYLSDHEGYPLLRYLEFIKDYGEYVLHVMKAIEHKVCTMDPVYASRFQSGLEFIESRSIQQQAGDIEELSQDRLRHLQTFLDNKDPEHIGLHRIILPNNDARWVCAEHYHHSYNDTLAKVFNTIVEINSGTFDTCKGIVKISLKTPVLRKEFIESFRLVTNVYELHLRLPWNTPLLDLNQLQAGLEQSSVVSLHLAFIPPQSVAEDAMFAKAKANIVARIMCNRKLEKVSFSKLSHFLSSAAQVQGELTHLKVLALDTLDVSQENKKLTQEIYELARLLGKCTQLKEFYLESLGENVAFGTLSAIYDGIQSSVQKLQLTTLKISCGQDSEAVFNYSRTEHDESFTVDLVARSFEHQVFVQKFQPRIRKLRITSDVLATEKKQLNYLKLFVKGAISLSDLELSCPAGEFISTLQEVKRMFDLKIQGISREINRPESCSLRLTDSQKYDYPTEENYLYTPNFIKQDVDRNYLSESVSRQEKQQQEISIHLPKIAKQSFLKFAMGLVGASLGRHLRSFTMPPKLETSEIGLLDKAVQSGPGLDVFSLAISSVKDHESWTHISHITKKSQEKKTPSEVKVALDLECGTGPQTDFVRNHLPAITSLWCTSPNLETWFQSLDDPGKDLGRLTELLLVFQYPQMAIKGQLLTRGNVQYMARFLSRCVGLRQLHLIDYPLDPLAWDTILEAINFGALADISFAGSNFGAGQIYTFLKRISKQTAPMVVEQDMSLITPCASESVQSQGFLDKGKGLSSDVDMTPVVQESRKPAPLLSVTFSHLGMSETAKMELQHIVSHQPNLWHCNVRFQ
ncbi:hypothetical protein BGZ52_009624 [Haplosporangium bisporale]|nr:hypothetical protein BGZ52_009624 [Haplosporangium bisporale]